MPSFKVPCPSCETQVLIKSEKQIGTKIECPKCKYRFKVESQPGGGVGAAADDGGKGGGKKNKKLGTILGAVGGAVGGHYAEKYLRKGKRWDVVVQLNDESHKTVSFDTEPPYRVGDRVKVEGDKLTTY